MSDTPEFHVETLDKPHLYSYAQKEHACALLFALWRDVAADRGQLVLCEPPALKETA